MGMMAMNEVGIPRSEAAKHIEPFLDGMICAVVQSGEETTAPALVVVVWRADGSTECRAALSLADILDLNQCCSGHYDFRAVTIVSLKTVAQQVSRRIALLDIAP